MGADHDGDLSLKFDFNKFVTLPYRLHYTWVGDRYQGEALEVYDRVGWFGSKHLSVPPNVAAVFLVSRPNADHRRLVLLPGRYNISRLLGRSWLNWWLGLGWWPVSVQYVRLDKVSFVMDDLKVSSRDRLYFTLDLWVTVQVIGGRPNDDPNALTRVAELHEPIDEIQHAIRQALTERLRTLTHPEAVELLPRLVEHDVAADVAAHFQPYGLEVHVGLTELKPDSTWEDLHRRAATVDKDNEVRRREAQREEDVFAIQQPGLRRMASVNIATQMRERNQQARMEAIDTVKDLAKALLEDLRLHPGRVYTERDMQPLVKALDLLDKLAQPVPAPQFPTQVRSYFALDATSDGKTSVPPPAELPDDLPVPPGSVWEKGQTE